MRDRELMENHPNYIRDDSEVNRKLEKEVMRKVNIEKKEIIMSITQQSMLEEE